jgi:hypothetical protein
MDHAPGDDMYDESAGLGDMEKNVRSRETWLRLLFMLILGVLFSIALTVTSAVVVIQFCYVLLQGEKNSRLEIFGHSLAIYAFEIIDYLTFNSDEKPFPFGADWPVKLPAE